MLSCLRVARTGAEYTSRNMPLCHVNYFEPKEIKTQQFLGKTFISLSAYKNLNRGPARRDSSYQR